MTDKKQGTEEKKTPYAFRIGASNINFPWPQKIAKKKCYIKLLWYTELWNTFCNQKGHQDRQIEFIAGRHKDGKRGWVICDCSSRIV